MNTYKCSFKVKHLLKLLTKESQSSHPQYLKMRDGSFFLKIGDFSKYIIHNSLNECLTLKEHLGISVLIQEYLIGS